MSPGAPLVVSTLAVVLAACTASGTDISPPGETSEVNGELRYPLFFPTGAAMAPDESVLFVANANSELRYNGGAIAVFDLAGIDTTVAAWTGSQQIVTPNCAVDGDRRETLQCDWINGTGSSPTDRFNPFLVLGAGVRIGNFATDVAVQDVGMGVLRLLVPVRGDPSITWADYGTDKKLACKAGAASFDTCDDDHILTYIHNDPDLALLPEEPFNVFADGPNGFAVVTHLSTGAVTLVDSPRLAANTPERVEIADVATGIFAPNSTTGLRGSTGVAGRTPTAGSDIVYVGSRVEDRIATFTVATPPNYPPKTDPNTGEVTGGHKVFLDGSYFFLDGVGSVAGSSSDTRGMAFSPSGNRMYLVNRDPPSLQVFDTSLDETGVPRNELVAATDICRQASTLAVLDAGDGERAYVTCFQDGQIYVVDPRGNGAVEDIITVGRGPYAVVASATRKKLYVTNFLEDTIAVVDVAPGSTTRNRVVLRIGTPKAP